MDPVRNPFAPGAKNLTEIEPEYREMQWWPKHKPIPDGAVLAEHQFPCHHHVYSVLIEWVKKI